MLLCLLYAVILGLKRQSDTLVQWLDKVFQKITGLDDYPTQSTISRFFESFLVEAAKGIAHVNQKILRAARGNFCWTKITLDLDSHVKTSYGHHQIVSVEYNPKRNLVVQVFTPCFALLGRQEIFCMGSSEQGKLIPLVG